MKVIPAILLVLVTFKMLGQQPKELLVLGVGVNAYNGDLGNAFNKWSASFYLGVKLNNKKRWNGNLNVGIGSITGQEVGYSFNGQSTDPPTPNTFFKTRVFNVSYDLHFNFIKKGPWIVYLSQGFGVVSFNPKDEFSQDLREQTQTRPPNEIYGNTAIILPTQLGAYYLLPNGFGFGLQTGYLNTTTDFLDNISQWGNKKGNDNVLVFKFSFVISLNKQSEEPTTEKTD